MADKGDGLTALDEHRGFFLDGGPGVATPGCRAGHVMGEGQTP